MRGTGPLRWKRYMYRGKNSKNEEPRWHRAAYRYWAGETYLKYVALCKYEMDGLRLPVQLSKAKEPKGDLCKHCERIAEQLAELHKTTGRNINELIKEHLEA